MHRTDGTGVLIDVRPDDRVSAADSAVLPATTVMAGQADWTYDQIGELPSVRAAKRRWLAGYEHLWYARAAVMAALAEMFAEPGPLRARAARVGDPPQMILVPGKGGPRARGGIPDPAFSDRVHPG